LRRRAKCARSLQSSCRTSSAKGLIMSLMLFINDTCPNCHKSIMHAIIEPHPRRRWRGSASSGSAGTGRGSPTSPRPRRPARSA
jgi:hypothetical protein